MLAKKVDYICKDHSLSIWITGPQSTNPKYLRNAKSEHLIG